MRYAWTMRVRPGQADTYVARHRAMGPDMRDLLTRAGYRDYAIFLAGDRVFGTFACDDVDRLGRVLAEDELAAHWRREMAALIENDPDPRTGSLPLLTPIFEHPTRG